MMKKRYNNAIIRNIDSKKRVQKIQVNFGGA